MTKKRSALTPGFSTPGIAGVRQLVPIVFASVWNSADATSARLKSAYDLVSVMTIAVSAPPRLLIVITSCVNEITGPDAIMVEEAA